MLQQTSNDATGTRERRTGHVIHYDISYILQGAEHGTDGAIVLLHDIPAGAFEWDSLLPQLAASNRAIYAIDMLGYGLSEHPWPSDTSIWGHADALAFLFNQLNLTNVVLVGHGIGGGVAQVMATRLSRSRVAALVLIDTTCYEYAYPPDWPLPDMRKAQDPDLPQRVNVEDMIRDLQSTLPNASSDPDRFKDAINPWIEQWNSHLGKEMLFQHIRLLIPGYSNAVSTDLKVMNKPTLIIWGENDKQVPLKYAQRLHHEIPESRLVIIPGAGHIVSFDAPDQVVSALSDFVGRL
jgi:pimeloyl-ACP methyl ester carboxylesterase